MKTKPWSIRILAFLFLFGPVINAWVGSRILHVGFSRYVSAFFQYSTNWELVAGLGLYPLAGLAIYAVRPWSYPVYLLVTAFSTWSNVTAWYRHPNLFTLPVLFLLTAIDVGLVSYFLLPAVRATYFNRKLRWWETKPRYVVDTPAYLDHAGAHIRITVSNISEGGAFIKSGKKLELGSTPLLSLSVFGNTLTVPVKIVYRRWKGLRGYGVEFLHTAETREQLTRLAKGFEQIGLKTVLDRPTLRASFGDWWTTLTHTGKGLVPVLPEQEPAVKNVFLLRKARARKGSKSAVKTDKTSHAA